MNVNRQFLSRAVLVITVLALIGSAVYFFLVRKFDLFLQIGIGLGIIGIALFALINPQMVRETFTGRQIKYSSNMAIYIVAVLGILVVVNILANRSAAKWDLTEDKANTLTEQSIQIIQNLPAQVEVIGFFSKDTSSDTARQLLDSFQEKSKGKVSYRIIDPASDPVTAQTYQVNRDGTLVMVLNGRQEQITLINETELISAMIRLSNPNKPVVYFLTGHGERSLEETGQNGFSQVKSILEKKNYDPRTLNLFVTPSIPQDAALIVIPGPQKPLSSNEVTLLTDFLNKGKRLIVMEDSRVITEFGEQADPLADYLLKDWGIRLNQDLVVDPANNPPTQAIANEYGSHPITRRLDRIVTIFPTARSVTASSNAPSGVSMVELVKTSVNSWGETDFVSLQKNQLQYDEGIDTPGPISIAVAATKSDTKARLVVFGSSFFASDQNFDAYANGDLLVNSIDWAAENDQLINLTPRAAIQRVLIPPSTLYVNLIFLLVIIFIPGGIIGAGIAMFLHRRRLG